MNNNIGFTLILVSVLQPNASLSLGPLTHLHQSGGDPPGRTDPLRYCQKVFALFDMVLYHWFETVLFIIASSLYKWDQEPGDRENLGGKTEMAVVRDLTLLSHSGQILIVPWSLGFNMRCWCGGCFWKVCKGVAWSDFRCDNEGSDLCVSLPADQTMARLNVAQ